MVNYMWLKSLLFIIFVILFSTNIFAATLSERTFKRLTVIHDLMGESKYDEALVLLDKLRPKTRNKKYEYANVMQTYAFAYAAKDQYKKAVTAFRESLSTNALPDIVQLPIRYNMAQLLAAIPNYQESAVSYEEWFSKAENKSTESYVFGATIYAQLNIYSKAVEKIKTAISMSTAPKESWYQLLLAMYYQEKKYILSKDVLETMVSKWPDNKVYWEQLSGIYFTLNENRKALAVQELSNKRGYLNEEKKLMNLVNMYLLESIPYKGAKLLEVSIKKGLIEDSGENLQKLGEAWMVSKENDKALYYLEKAALKQGKGKLYLQIAQLYTDTEKWGKVITTIDQALKTGNLKNPGKAYLLLGMAYYEEGKKQKALTAFREGNKFPKSAKQAKQWINHLNSNS